MRLKKNAIQRDGTGFVAVVPEDAEDMWHAYNLISTIGAFIIALGVLLTIINVVRSLKHGAIAGPDPWKANSLEWFTPSPPPEHNFDAIPRVRSVEPMKDYRRQIGELSGSEQRFEAGKPMAHV